jgi:hypothetical protein
VLAALDTPQAMGEVFNVGESVTPTMREWIGQISPRQTTTRNWSLFPLR